MPMKGKISCSGESQLTLKDLSRSRESQVKGFKDFTNSLSSNQFSNKTLLRKSSNSSSSSQEEYVRRKTVIKESRFKN